MFEFEVFRKQMYSIEESTCDNGLFRAPAVIRHAGSYAPPLYAPAVV